MYELKCLDKSVVFFKQGIQMAVIIIEHAVVENRKSGV